MIRNATDICDDIDNVVVIRCRNERELLMKWIDLINDEDPDFITCYNILGFDFNYIHHRVKELFNDSNENIIIGMKNIDYNLGRLNIDCRDKYYNKKNIYKKVFRRTEENNDFNDQSYINMDGRIIFDVQKEIEK